MKDKPEFQGANLSVLLSLGLNLAETIAMGIAAWMTSSVALRAQTIANVADLAVSAFLLIGVVTSARPSDDSHPLGYGRERFFWSLFAALGIFVVGGGLSLDEAFQSAMHPTQVDSYLIAYIVLAVTVALDAIAMVVAWRPLRQRAKERGVSMRATLKFNTDPALTTVAIGGACAVIGGIAATVGLIVTQLTGSPMADAVSSGFIGLLLIVSSAFLLNANRELLTGRGVSPLMLRDMRRLIAGQPGVVHVRDLFAVVVGPSSVIVNGDITFVDEMNVPAVESAIVQLANLLREHWPIIEFVYLTPVSLARPRRVRRAKKSSEAGEL